MISVIIPVYNHARTLRRCLRSLEFQTYRPPEVVIVNDGSTDNFDEVIKSVKTSFNFIVINQKNFGAAAARNRGFKESNGKYVIFWDADTVGKPEMLAKLKEALAGHPEASYAYSQFRFGWKKMKSQPFNPDDLRRYNYIDTTSLIRREVLVDIPGPFDESLQRFQDWDLWLTLLERNKTGMFVPEVLYRKLVRGRVGISAWWPSFMYQLPWRPALVRRYQEARQKVLAKHRLIVNIT
ncbi:MAG: glycosyltransferase family 2 protein [Candidatus Magasanikbacteria bacterium]|nr:glycosyltransferase family 2 protein [Candidatus Magasanikbacteria bacterium]